MDNDRELLEAVAMAANANGARISDKGVDGFYDSERREWWNPRDDDGDEARLEATLGLNVCWSRECVEVFSSRVLTVREWYFEHNGDKQAARRSAGTRAAAAIGKAMLQKEAAK